jgi:glycine/D-amino acid oxidase-like deaminating enzyme
MDVLIVGAGINGLCAAWALCRAGHRVQVFDAAPIPNTAGTSYDEHRLIRTPYGDQRGYALMMREGWAAWDRLWADLGRRHVAVTGCLALSTAPDDWTDRSARTLDALGIGYERISPAALAARFPMLRTEDARFGLYDPDGGLLFADRIVDDVVAWLAAHGVALHGETAIAAVDEVAPAIRTATGRRIMGDAVLVTTGVWAAQLFPDLAGTYVPLRQVVAYVEPPAALTEAWRTAPAMLDLGGPRGMFLAPPVGGRGFKLGCGAYNRPCGLDEEAGIVPEDGPVLLDFYRHRLQQWEAFRIRRLRMCRYGNEPAQRFILQRRGPAWVLTGCSGHGFKFGPLMGEALAEAACGRSDPVQLARWVAGQD